jgi:TRAP-type C4-dicarboxylate transport system permease small subunit
MRKKMRKIYQGILCIIIGSAFLMSLWVLTHYFLVGGIQEVIIGGVKHALIRTPAPISIPVIIAYFLFFGGTGLILFGILRLVQTYQKR